MFRLRLLLTTLLTMLALLRPNAAAQQVQTLKSGDWTVTLTPTQPGSNHWYQAGKLEIQGTGEGIRGVETSQLRGAMLGEISPNGRWVSVLHTGGGYAQLWNTATAERKFTLLAHDKKSYYARVAAFSPDSRRVVFYSYPYELSLWDTATGERVKLLSDVRKGKWWTADAGVVFSPDGKSFVLTGGGGAAQLFATATGDLLQTFDRPWQSFGPGYPGRFWRGATAAVFSPDGKNLAVLYAGGQARLYDVTGAQALAKANWTLGDYKPSQMRFWSGKLTLNGRELSGTAGSGLGFRLRF
ncbi:hypothetical protein [Deinococcus sp.]|uniref:WD40 repeat domain-containing protein n=1 Tax=Deinococcus sp. TaxID=47478 RepID=UPI0025BD8A99|nr:hypothetical protein [Deinococcus sp.]